MTSSTDNIRVGVLGASGYIGAEVMRYVALHPNLSLRWATANRDAGRLIGDVLPNLRGFFPHTFLTAEGGESRIDDADVVFLALPHSESQDVLPRLVDHDPEKIWIDLAGDFRTPDPAGFEKYYGGPHRAADLLERFVYGFTEGQREALAGSRLIANPGCFATGTLLALYPLVNTGMLSDPICVTALTGSSGSGRAPVSTTHHPERAQNIRAYKILKHQHLLEVEWFLNGRSDTEIRLQFVPQSAPIVRGIFTTLFLPGQSADAVLEVFEQAYGHEPLIDVITGSPDIRVVGSTPKSIIGVAGEDGRGAVVFSAIDNLGKGAASQAIQNMNCALGLPETTGLDWPGGFV
jgi:N-acetyl-gamma-glutamyl-phosphate reductase common form